MCSVILYVGISNGHLRIDIPIAPLAGAISRHQEAMRWREMLNVFKEGVVVIDVGVNRIGMTPEGKAKLAGDVDFDGVKEKAAAITPVPGGVGPMTITMLMLNTLKAAKVAANIS